MTEFGFYHLTRTPLETALPKLLERVRSAGFKAVVILGSEDRVQAVSHALWTYDPASFLAHGSARDGYPQLQPIWLTVHDENPNGAEVLVLADGADVPSAGTYTRCLDLFDGRDEAAVMAARGRWKHWRDAGHSMKYWRQTETGWELAKG